jgi:hypothetical protein
LSLPCRHLAARYNVQVVFWGMYWSYFLICLSEQLIFQQLGYLPQPLVELFDAMCSEEPSSRPLASTALQRVRQIQQDIARETLSSRVPFSPVQIKLLVAQAAELSAYITARKGNEML